MSKEKNQKMTVEEPFELKYSNFRAKLFDVVNDAYSSGVPFYLMETIVWQLYNQIQQNAHEEVKQAQQRYRNEILSQKDFKTPETEAIKTATEENESN